MREDKSVDEIVDVIDVILDIAEDYRKNLVLKTGDRIEFERGQQKSRS